MSSSPEVLKEIYSNRFDKQRIYRNRVWQVLVANFFQKFIPADSSVLDIGCGYGQFINNIRCRTRYGMDLNPAARDNLDASVIFLEQDCSDVWPFPDGSLDSVFTSNFFEHLPDKTVLERTVREAARCLRSGGLLIAMGPNVRCLPGTYWDFWDHYIALSELSLSELFTTVGLTIERALARFLPYTMVGQREVPMTFVRWYLRFPLLWSLRGGQFLVIAKKP